MLRPIPEERWSCERILVEMNRLLENCEINEAFATKGSFGIRKPKKFLSVPLIVRHFYTDSIKATDRSKDT